MTEDTYILTNKKLEPRSDTYRLNAWKHVLAHVGKPDGLVDAKAAIDAMPHEDRGTVTGNNMFSWLLRENYVVLCEADPIEAIQHSKVESSARERILAALDKERQDPRHDASPNLRLGLHVARGIVEREWTLDNALRDTFMLSLANLNATLIMQDCLMRQALEDIARQPEGDEQSAQAIAKEVLRQCP